MAPTAHRRAAPGELVAYDLPPGPHWLEIVEAHANDGVSFLPLDVRLSAREKRRLLDLARPTIVVDPAGETLFDGAPADPDRAWAVMATSGSAGAPRLAELPRAALGSAVASSFDALGIGETEPWLACLTPAHVGGLLVLLRGVLGGAPVRVLQRFEPEAVARELATGVHVALVPTMLRRLLAFGADLSTAGVLLVGGARLDPALREAAIARGARVVSTYGLTEACGGVAYDGVPVGDAAVRVGDDGEIEVCGPSLMKGYRADPAATAAAFTADGWLRTRDVGRLVDGRLTVLGRDDDAIRTGGETVWPGVVEEVLRTHPKVAEVAVAGRPDEEWGECVVAWVVPRHPSDPPTLDALREHCRVDLARHEAPKALVLATELPRTPSGKLRRGDLPGNG